MERHCNATLAQQIELDWADETNEADRYLAPYLGPYQDPDGRAWLIWQDISGPDRKPVLTLADLVAKAHELQLRSPQKDPQEDDTLSLLMEALGWGTDRDAALRRLLYQLLTAVEYCHRVNIVHRDIKPGNLLVDPSSGSIRLIDMGSSADMTPGGGVFDNMLGSVGLGGGGRVGFDAQTAPVSPIYSAPELYVDPIKKPLNFDVFSVAMVYFELAFPNLASGREMAAFRQALGSVDFDLELWVQGQMEATVLPNGVTSGILHFGRCPEAWNLLNRMVVPVPLRRISAEAALRAPYFSLPAATDVVEDVDAPPSFLSTVVENAQYCMLPTALEGKPKTSDAPVEPVSQPSELPPGQVQVQPLSVIANFRRAKPLGLVLASVDDEVEDYQKCYPQEAEEMQALWDRGTADAGPGDVFIREIVEKGQAESMGLLQIGDRLSIIGDLDVSANGGGFSRAVQLLSSQPRRQKTTRLVFSRKALAKASTPQRVDEERAPQPPEGAKDGGVVDCGAWSVTGQRSYQEDTFVLTHFKTTCESKELYLAGVFDGHAGSIPLPVSTSINSLLVNPQRRRNRSLDVLSPNPPPKSLAHVPSGLQCPFTPSPRHQTQLRGVVVAL